jgi:hypothetical protein
VQEEEWWMCVEESEDGKEDGRVRDGETTESVSVWRGLATSRNSNVRACQLDLRLTIPGRRRDWLTCGRAPQ